MMMLNEQNQLPSGFPDGLSQNLPTKPPQLTSLGLPSVAVVIVNYNGGEWLLRCLATISCQTYPNYRVIVVDNASHDDSLDRAREAYPHVDYVEAGSNLGFAVGNNVGFARARDCTWLACLNPDAFPETDWLERLVSAALNHPEFTFFGSLMRAAEDPGRLDGTEDVYHISGAAWRLNFRAPASCAGRDLKEIFGPCAAASLYRRDIVEEVGGFDEHFFCYFEDVDLAFRLRLRGYRCAYVPDAVVHHMGSAITGYQSDFTIYHGHRNLEWAFIKNMPWALLWWAWPQHVLLNCASLIGYTLRGHGRVIMRAKWHALLGLSQVWRARRQIQAQRRVSAGDLLKVMQRGWLTPYGRRSS